MALLHYRSITRVDRKLVMLRTSANGLDERVRNLGNAQRGGKLRIMQGVLRAFLRGVATGRGRGRGHSG